MLRLIPPAVHTLEHVKRTIDVFSEVKAKLTAGKYNLPIPNMNMVKKKQ
jgi:glycine C-acetyltransferase